MFSNARFVTKYVKENRVAEVFELDDKTGYIIRMKHNKEIKEDRVIQGKSVYHIVDVCESWCDGVVDPWI